MSAEETGAGHAKFRFRGNFLGDRAIYLSMRKIPCFSALVVLLLSASAAAASAHAVFVGAPNGVPTNSEQALSMGVPHERDDTTYNVDIVIAMPAGWQPLSCQTKSTWSCSIGTSGDRQVIHFVKAAGASVAEDETFQFSVRAASTVGSFSFPTIQTYNTGEVVRWIDAAGGAEPAPTLATLPSCVEPQTTAPTTTVDHSPQPTTPATTRPTLAPTPAPTTPAPTTAAPPTTTPPTIITSSTTSTTVVATTSTPTSALPSTTVAPLDHGDDGDGGGSGLAVALALTAVVAVGGTGAVLVVRRRRGRPPPE